jgi:hypothetical protein
MTTFLAPVTQALLQDNFSDNTSLDPNERSYPTGPASYYGRTQIMLSLTRLGNRLAAVAGIADPAPGGYSRIRAAPCCTTSWTPGMLLSR